MPQEPPGDLHARGHGHALGLSLDHYVAGVDGHDEAFDVDGEPARVGEDVRGPLGLMAGIADVGMLGAVDHKRAAADPDLRAGVVLGVRSENTAGSDDDVVDVRAAVADWDGVQEPPARVLPGDLRELRGNLLFSVRVDAPGPLVGVDTKDACKHGLDGG